jgi:hypothetical protein
MATLLAVLSSDAFATTYFVRKSGSDSRNGRSPANAFHTIGKAVSVAVAGDTIYVGAGTYYENPSTSRDGTSTNPIQLIADKTGAQTGDSGMVRIRGSLTVTGDHYHIKDFRFEGSADLVILRDNVGARLQGSEIVGGENGLFLRNTNCIIENCIVRDCDDDGVELEGTLQVEITQCAIQQCDGDGVDFQGTGLVVARNTTIEYCSGNGIEADSAGTRGLLVDRCKIFDNGSHGISLVDECTSIVCNSLLARNTRAGYRLEVSSTNRETGFLLHCTITHNRDEGIRNSGYRRLYLWNNIVTFNNDEGLASTSNVTREYNIFYGNGGGDSSAATGTNIRNDPKFVSTSTNDFRLGPGSPAIDRAQPHNVNNPDLNTVPMPTVTTDLVGTSRPRGAASDVGCYESGPAGFASYYVRTDGDDARSGTSASLAFRTITKAATVVNPGDTVYIGGGTYRENPSVSRAGAADQTIRFIGDVSGAKTGVAGPVILAPPVKNTNSMTVTQAHFTEFHAIRFSGGDFPYDPTPGANYSVSPGVIVANTSSVTFDACEFDLLAHGVQSAQPGQYGLGGHGRPQAVRDRDAFWREYPAIGKLRTGSQWRGLVLGRGGQRRPDEFRQYAIHQLQLRDQPGRLPAHRHKCLVQPMADRQRNQWNHDAPRQPDVRRIRRGRVPVRVGTAGQ